jgi:hypothetical protein
MTPIVRARGNGRDSRHATAATAALPQGKRTWLAPVGVTVVFRVDAVPAGEFGLRRDPPPFSFEASVLCIDASVV